jgi:hypothetical protein
MYWRYPATAEGIAISKNKPGKPGFIKIAAGPDKGKVFPRVHLDDATGSNIWRGNVHPCDACGQKFKTGEDLYCIEGFGDAGAIHRRCAEVVPEEKPFVVEGASVGQVGPVEIEPPTEKPEG